MNVGGLLLLCFSICIGTMVALGTALGYNLTWHIFTKQYTCQS